MEQHLDKKAYLMMTITPVLWSMGGLLIKMLPWQGIVIAGIRSGISAVVFFVAIKYVMKYPVIINRSTLLGGVFLGYLAGSFAVANKMTTAANAIVLQSTGPIFILIASAVIFKEKFRKGDYIAVITAMGGIMLFFADKLSTGQMMGNFVALSSGVAMAALYMFNNKSKSDEETMSALLMGHVYIFIGSIPFWFTSPPEITMKNVVIIVVLGVFQLGIPYVLYSLSIRRLPVLTCSMISLLEPLLNPVWVALFAGEIPGPFALLGTLIVLCSIAGWTVYNAKVPTSV